MAVCPVCRLRLAPHVFLWGPPLAGPQLSPGLGPGLSGELSSVQLWCLHKSGQRTWGLLFPLGVHLTAPRVAGTQGSVLRGCWGRLAGCPLLP